MKQVEADRILRFLLFKDHHRACNKREYMDWCFLVCKATQKSTILSELNAIFINTPTNAKRSEILKI